jgi:hypothetical protein
MPGSQSTRACPNCAATFSAGSRQCPVCKLEVAKMDAFAAAKQAARKKGLQTTKVQEAGTPVWRRPIVIGVLLGLLLLAFIIAKFSGAGGPPPWTQYPSTKEEVVKQLFTDIAVGDDPGYDKAYALIAPSARNPEDSDEKGHYRQLDHEVYRYLSGEFGADWLSTLQIEQDPTNSDMMIAHVGLETLHVPVVLETPADKLNDNNHHYAITGIQEFDISEAAGFQQTAGVMAVLGAEAGQGAVRNLTAVIGAAGASHHESPMQTKLRLLPILRDPRMLSKYEIYQTWPIRKDPVVRHRLDAIVEDDRYPPELKEVAKEVLNDSVTDEELIAAHVNF